MKSGKIKTEKNSLTNKRVKWLSNLKSFSVKKKTTKGSGQSPTCEYYTN
jgi:hypothetical protein